MTTQADKKRDEALVHVKAAIKLLAEIVIDQCNGADDYQDDYLQSIHDSMNKLVEIRNELN